MSTRTVRTAPPKLGAKARKFWRETCAIYDLSAHEALLLEGACREIDIIERLEKDLDGASLMVSGSMGQMVANPLLQEVRMHRAAFGSIVKQLNLPDAEEPAAVKSPASQQASKAAAARWSRG